MKSYSPSHVDPRQTDGELVDGPPAGFEPPSDAQLVSYVQRYWQAFRAAVEQHFGALSSELRLYAKYPYESTILRVGSNGVIIAQKPAAQPAVRVLRPQDLTPPLDDLNIFQIRDRLGAALLSFDARYRAYDDAEAQSDGAHAAFQEALSVFWHVLGAASFEVLCRDLAEAEGIRVQAPSTGSMDGKLDLLGTVYLDEPAEFVREETWGFQLKHSKIQRTSAPMVRDAERMLGDGALPVDILCIVSSGDMTSIGRSVAVNSPRMRVWDRPVLDALLHGHPDVMARYFRPYAEAVDRMQADRGTSSSATATTRSALQGCPAGQGDFRRYEDIGVGILRFLFAEELGEPRVQARTQDGVERRDVVSRNNRQSRFFQRIREKFDADFVIWDFKNYGEPVGGEVINDVATYANPALGRFIIVVSRLGGAESAQAAQLRRLRNDGRLVLVVSDEQLLEMVNRKEGGESPADVLEDLLDEILLAF